MRYNCAQNNVNGSTCFIFISNILLATHVLFHFSTSYKNNWTTVKRMRPYLWPSILQTSPLGEISISGRHSSCGQAKPLTHNSNLLWKHNMESILVAMTESHKPENGAPKYSTKLRHLLKNCVCQRIARGCPNA